ncbi:predicted protein [Uncinocarpus reesii 1704]|uniref:Uncharacterized protein n=1 Tax=Uncinocarpus reesii (strain UAMH 1704) TaxID=336963 RepID=C4JJI5_UNCRE|nr:uncharacterized protein UREG_01792 [Uncinocarpus reesii 1704]EEP76943.1 predicted protein [Uncinocarpus reesii 1704]
MAAKARIATLECGPRPNWVTSPTSGRLRPSAPPPRRSPERHLTGLGKRPNCPKYRVSRIYWEPLRNRRLTSDTDCEAPCLANGGFQCRNWKAKLFTAPAVAKTGNQLQVT